MAKLRYIVVPLVLVAASWFYETSGYRRYGADEPGVAPGDVSWLAVIGRAAVGTVAYVALDAIRRRHQQRRHGQVTGQRAPSTPWGPRRYAVRVPAQRRARPTWPAWSGCSPSAWACW